MGTTGEQQGGDKKGGVKGGKAQRVDKDRETHTQGVSGRSKARGNKSLRVVITTADISSYSSTLSVRKWNRKMASWSAC